MCTSPIRIINRSNHWNETQPFYIYVPCGHCQECCEASRREWFVRCYYESLYSERTFFYTLTYNNDNLPYIMGFPCFSKRHIQLFFKRLRKILSKYEIKLKYLVSCEYGEKFHRPHYHILFFLDAAISPFLFSKFVSDSWTYGFVKPGDNCGVVHGDRGIAYVVKYVSKDFNFVDADFYNDIMCKLQKRIISLFNYVRAKSFDSRLDSVKLMFGKYSCYISKDSTPFQRKFCEPFLKKYHNWLRDSSPFHLQSQYLGIKYLDRSGVKDALDTISILRSSGNIEFYNFPRYFKRKLWYDVVESASTHKKDSFVLTDEGIEHYINIIDKRIKDVETSYSKLLSFAHDGKIKYELFNYIRSHTDVFYNYETFLYYLDNVVTTHSIHILAIYSLIFRGRVCSLDWLFTYDSSENFLETEYKKVLYCQLKNISSFDFGRIYDSLDNLTYNELSEYFDLLLYDYIPLFQRYEFLCQILQIINDYESKISSQRRLNDEKHFRLVKEILNPPF